MLKSLETLLIFLVLTVSAQEKCGDSKHEDKSLAWQELSKIEFLAEIPFKIPGGLLCAGFHSKNNSLEQLSYKSSEGSLRVYNRKFILGTKRTVIQSDDFLDSSLIKTPLPILSFLVKEEAEQYPVTIEYINRFNPLEGVSAKGQKYVEFTLHLNKSRRALFYPTFKTKSINRLLLEIDVLFQVHTLKMFNGQELITALKTKDL